MAFSTAMIAAWPDILNCSGKQHDPFEKCCLQGASSFVHVLTFHCGKTCLAGLAYTCAECVQWSGSCWNPLLRMEQPPTVVVVDRRGLRFNFWTALHHQQFQNRNKHEKNKFSKQSLAVSPCPTSSGLDACHRFLEKRPVRTEDVCPWVYLYELCCALDCVKFLLNCFGPYRSMQDKVVDIPPKDQKDSKGIIPTSGALDCTVCHHGWVVCNLSYWEQDYSSQSSSKDASNFWVGDLPEVDFLTHEQKKSIEV